MDNIFLRMQVPFFQQAQGSHDPIKQSKHYLISFQAMRDNYGVTYYSRLAHIW